MNQLHTHHSRLEPPRKKILPLLFFLLLFLFSLQVQAQSAGNCQPSDLLLVVDYSGSMAGRLRSGKTKWQAAQSAFQTLLTQYAKKLRFGLVTFSDKSTLQVWLGPNRAQQCLNWLMKLQPKGRTAMKCALQDAYKHFRNNIIPNDPIKDRRRYVMLITDGIPNNCGTDVVSEVRRLRNIGVGGKLYDVKTYVIGFGSGIDPKQLQGMAAAGGTGQYYQADSLPSLQKAITGIANGASKELCNNKDDDCDGKVDGFIGLCQGACGRGTRECKKGQWSACKSSKQAGKEVCNNIDDDCDGLVDQGLTRSCRNACGVGTEVCNKGRWVNCGAPLPSKEVCDNRDNNCNGQIDENISKTCKSQCGVGHQRCQNGQWTACDAPNTPSKEVCNNKDDDCNGTIDDKLFRKCSNKCGKGNQTCRAGKWGNCSAPSAKKEECNGQDDNCNGQIDEGVKRACTTKCGSGTQACIQGDWSTCSAPRPSAEICDGRDNDCDGKADNGATCPGGTCTQGKCFRNCSNGECPSGFLCDPRSRVCQPKPCTPACSNGQRCQYGNCVSSDCTQAGAECPSGELCINKKCRKNICLGIKCDKGQFCDPTIGKCRHSCAKVQCSEGQVCRNGVCQNDPCYGKQCSGTCQAGKCLPLECPAKACTNGKVCLNGLCVQNKCEHITCPQGERCVDGECYGSNGPLGPPKPPKTTPDGGGTTPTNPNSPDVDVTSIPDGNAGTRGKTPPKASGGCLCHSSQQKNQNNFPLSLLFLFLFLPAILHRRSRR